MDKWDEKERIAMIDTSGFAKLNDTTLFYEMKGSGDPLVFIHSGGFDRRMWDGQFEFFSAYTVIRYDARGYGKSKAPTRPYSEQADLFQLLEHKDAIHIHVGLTVFCLAVVIWRRGRLDCLSLLPVFTAAVAMEFLDLRDDLVSLGYMRWSSSAHDLINTVFWATMAVIAFKWLGTREN